METSLVITTFNRAELLDRSLERLAMLTPPEEVIVVDDGGSDHTAQVCERWSGQGHLPAIRYLYNDNPGATICSLARNIGVRQATRPWIVTSEPELIFRTDVIHQFIELHLTHPLQVISTGLVYFAPGGFNPLADPTGLQIAGDYVPGREFQKAVGWVAPYAALWKRAWIEEVRGWDETFPGPWGWDDIDLLTRLRLNGIGQHIATEVEGIHQFHGLGGDVQFVNEKHFRAKSFQRDERDLTDVVANKEHEWGQLRTSN